jgi:hypothetical protein
MSYFLEKTFKKFWGSKNEVKEKEVKVLTKAQIEKSNFKFEFCMDWEETELDVFSEKID